MKGIRKYACSRLYVKGECSAQSVVGINGEGMVECYGPLSEETPATEWIGGAIVLSDKETLPGQGTSGHLLHDLLDAESPKYAWHIFPFDFEKGGMTPSSIIRRL